MTLGIQNNTQLLMRMLINWERKHQLFSQLNLFNFCISLKIEVYGIKKNKANLHQFQFMFRLISLFINIQITHFAFLLHLLFIIFYLLYCFIKHFF
ncbi:unnamed protein product [Paramecium sonneborni]|uniref:Transmembrane protein n=1 Tax=Paramecium sonneborni TaxID=65129 RepID=A0A8S1REL5_9CILI|nr:unnamed protein product [Paramecium sonneborni]